MYKTLFFKEITIEGLDNAIENWFKDTSCIYLTSCDVTYIGGYFIAVVQYIEAEDYFVDRKVIHFAGSNLDILINNVTKWNKRLKGEILSTKLFEGRGEYIMTIVYEDK